MRAPPALALALALALSLVCLTASPCRAEGRVRLDGGLTFSRFEQQVKTGLGGERGARLVEEMQLGYAQSLTYRIGDFPKGPSLSAGGFMQIDVGQREQARFAGFDAEGKTTIRDTIGGRYVELWMGPLVRVEYRRIFGEVGYALYGARRDDARGDLVTGDGDRTGTLHTSATVAWTFAVGGRVPLSGPVDLVLRMQYRIRYYDERSGARLAGGAVHGTQNYTPFVGLAWTLGPTR